MNMYTLWCPQIMSMKVEGDGSGRHIYYESGSYMVEVIWKQILDGSEINEKLYIDDGPNRVQNTEICILRMCCIHVAQQPLLSYSLHSLLERTQPGILYQ